MCFCKALITEKISGKTLILLFMFSFELPRGGGGGAESTKEKYAREEDIIFQLSINTFPGMRGIRELEEKLIHIESASNCLPISYENQNLLRPQKLTDLKVKIVRQLFFFVPLIFYVYLNTSIRFF
jgi:ABC-type transport system involved in Fe-S cluster assembly fused permease/ATPase subunit